ncbi:MAG TPA: SUMF1/EgtB/PvdO family nonheme iron enzyme [Aggregatilineales bacterium]|nr:SUMF1/EgtB/PvdO family nonheme iron enzyme [Aggregatilineales bacterium]
MSNHSTLFKPSSLDLLPKPFVWITIPTGEVTLEAGGYLDDPTTFTIPTFQMAKYPVTNAQYKLFIDAGGYDEKRWWTEDGWQAKLDGWVWNGYDRKWEKTGVAWVQPRYWDNPVWKEDSDCPVIGVSWYEAVAFCNWLSEATSEKITLPTEQQWQRAAQGDDNRLYPWGNIWDKTKCNNSEISTKTTSVTQFEGLGDSPYSITDMIGNVWQWSLTVFETGDVDLGAKGFRIIRGKAWGVLEYTDNMYVSERLELHPNDANANLGFRLVRHI